MSKVCQILGVKPMSGNNVSHSNRKTKRRFLPNLKVVAFFSDTMKQNIRIRVATSTLRTINKHGNIDSFLINYPFAKLSDFAKSIRNKVKKKLIESNKIDDVKIAYTPKQRFVSARKKLASN